MTESVRCSVGAVRTVVGWQWIEANTAQRERWWSDVWTTFLNAMPANMQGWIEEPAEETVYDEEHREVRLVVEGVARVPGCPGYEVGPLREPSVRVGLDPVAYCDARGQGDAEGLVCDLEPDHADPQRHVEQHVAVWHANGSVQWAGGSIT